MIWISFLRKFLQPTPRTRFIFFVFSDILIIISSVWLSFFLRFDAHIPEYYLSLIPSFVLLELIITIPIFYVFKLYSFSWSYVGIKDLISLLKATLLGLGVVALAVFFAGKYGDFLGLPRSVIIMSYILILGLAGGFRFSKRAYLEFLLSDEKNGTERALIVGAGNEGEQIVRSILQADSNPYLPVGFVDDNTFKMGNIIHGIPVLGSINALEDLIKKHDIEALIIALPSTRSESVRKAVDLGRKGGLSHIKVMPLLSEIIGGNISVRNLRDVHVEDLLGRTPVALDESSIQSFLRGNKVLITGAGGSIGSELTKQISKFDPALLCVVDREETAVFHLLKDLRMHFPKLPLRYFIADIQGKEKLHRIFQEIQPDVVFHAAAYKHVPLMEEHPDEAVRNNILGTHNLIEESIEHFVDKFVFVSTDKAVNPSSVMGMTKRFGEMLCQFYNQQGITKFVSVRFGNVLESRGSVIPIFREQIRRGGPVEITHPDMKRYFMMNSEACLLVMQAGAMGQGGEVFVLDMGEPVKIVDLANEMIRLSGYEPDVDIPIVFTGVRPGEKLFEDILTAEEGTVATHHEKIFIAKMGSFDYQYCVQTFRILQEKSRDGHPEEVRIILRNFYQTPSAASLTEESKSQSQIFQLGI